MKKNCLITKFNTFVDSDELNKFGELELDIVNSTLDSTLSGYEISSPVYLKDATFLDGSNEKEYITTYDKIKIIGDNPKIVIKNKYNITLLKNITSDVGCLTISKENECDLKYSYDLKVCNNIIKTTSIDNFIKFHPNIIEMHIYAHSSFSEPSELKLIPKYYGQREDKYIWSNGFGSCGRCLLNGTVINNPGPWSMFIWENENKMIFMSNLKAPTPYESKSPNDFDHIWCMGYTSEEIAVWVSAGKVVVNCD